jgi:hypothetical protein
MVLTVCYAIPTPGKPETIFSLNALLLWHARKLLRFIGIQGSQSLLESWLLNSLLWALALWKYLLVGLGIFGR